MEIIEVPSSEKTHFTSSTERKTPQSPAGSNLLSELFRVTSSPVSRGLAWLQGWGSSSGRAEPVEEIELQEVLMGGRAIRQDYEHYAASVEDHNSCSFRPGRKAMIAGALLGLSFAAYKAYEAWSGSAESDRGGDNDMRLPPFAGEDDVADFMPPVAEPMLSTGYVRRLPGPGIKQPLRKQILPKPSNDVKIEKMFDFSCIEERNALTWANVIRKVGTTLSSPFKELGRESQIIHTHNTLGRGCPTEQERMWLENITETADYLLGFFMFFMPGAQIPAVLQTLVGPGLQLVADGLEGKKLNYDNVAGITDQLMLMTQMARTSMSLKEMDGLYAPKGLAGKGISEQGKAPVKGTILSTKKTILPEKGILQKRFIYDNDKIKVRVDNSDYSYQVTDSGISFVKPDGSYRLIRYNQQESAWETVTEKDYLPVFAANRANQALYGIPVNQALSAKNIPAIKTDSLEGTTLMTTGKEAPGDFVIMEGKIIPVEQYSINEEGVTVASSVDLDKKAVMRQTEYGWEFEPSGVEMDRALELLLESGDSGTYFTRENKFSEIQPDGFSYNEKDEIFLKKDNRYYPVKKIAGVDEWYLPGYSGSRIMSNNQMFRLVEADDMLFSLAARPVGARNLEPSDSPLLLEEGALKQIISEGVRVESSSPHTRLAPGVYQDAEAKNTLFTIPDGDSELHFQVTAYDGKKISLARKTNGNQEQSTFDLWREGNTWLHVRKAKEGQRIDYKESDIQSCRARRQVLPGDGCLPVMVETTLDEQLETLCTNGGASKRVFDDTLEGEQTAGADLSTILYVDKKNPRKEKHYLLYKEHLIDAELETPPDENTDMTFLKLFSSKGTFLRRRPSIAEVVIEKKEASYEIKTRSAALAEKVNVSQDIAAQYLHNQQYENIPDAELISRIIEDVNRVGEMFIAPVRYAKYRPTLEKDLHTLLRENLYPDEYVDKDKYDIAVYDLKGRDEALPQSVADARVMVKQHVDYISSFLLDWVIKDEAFATEAPREYISKVLKTPNKDFHTRVYEALDDRMDRLSVYLSPKNIKLVKVSMKDGANYGLLSASEKRSGSTVFLNPDDNKLYINVDKMEEFPSVDLARAILREALREHHMTVSITNYKYLAGTLHPPILDMVDDMGDTIRLGKVDQPEEFAALTRNYLKVVTPYREMNAPSNEALAYLLENEPGYRTHIVLNSPDTLAAMIMDLGTINTHESPMELNQLNAPGDPTIVKGVQTIRTGLNAKRVFQNVMDIEGLAKETVLQKMAKDPEINEAMKEPQEKCEWVAPAVAKFMKENGFDKIRYRAMAFFLRPDDTMPNTHFVVLGDKNGKTWVFDVTAGQFQTRYEELSGPIILPEEIWAQKYANIMGKSLIVYGDYDSARAAEPYFGASSKYLSWGAEYKIPGTQVLRRSPWYYPELVSSEEARKRKRSTESAYSDLDGVLVKNYNLAYPENHKTRLQLAMNNANGMNRIYGKGSAIVTMSAKEGGESDVKVSTVKLPGKTVSDILKVTDEESVKNYRTSLEKVFSASSESAAEMAEVLYENGVHLKNVTTDNLLFAPNYGFTPINFDNAEIYPADETINTNVIAEMTQQFNSLIDKVQQKFSVLQSEQTTASAASTVSTTSTTSAPVKKKTGFALISSLIDDLGIALQPGWYMKPVSLTKANALKSETEKALRARAITPDEANRLSARIGNIRVKIVDLVLEALRSQKRRYDNLMTSKGGFDGELLKKTQEAIDLVEPVQKTLYSLGAMLNRLFLDKTIELPPVTTTKSPPRKKTSYELLSSRVEEMSRKMVLVWYKNTDNLNTVNALKTQVDEALAAHSIKPTQAKILSGKIGNLRIMSVDKNLAALKAQRENYKNSVVVNANLYQLRLVNLQKEINTLNKAYEVLHGLGVKLNKVFMDSL